MKNDLRCVCECTTRKNVDIISEGKDILQWQQNCAERRRLTIMFNVSEI